MIMSELRLSHEEAEDIQELTASRRYKVLVKIVEHFLNEKSLEIHTVSPTDKDQLVFERGRYQGYNEFASLIKDLKQYVRGGI